MSSLLTSRVLLILVMLFMASVLWRDAHSSWAFSHRPGYVYDNYYSALVAKNISQGNGWSLSDGRRLVPFEREISTGPMVFMPVVLAMQWISDMDDAKYLGVIGINIFLMGLLLFRLRLFFRPLVCQIAWIIIPFVWLAFMREQWYLVLGEVSATLLLLLSASYAAEKNLSRQQIILSGLFSGMAVMSKLLAALCIPWILGVIFLTLIYQQDLWAGIKKLLPWFFGFSLVPGIVAIWHFIGLQGDIHKFISYTLDYLGFYFGLGLEDRLCLDIYYCFKVNFRAASSSWPSGGGVALAALTSVMPIIGAWLVFKRKKSPAEVFFILISGICLIQLLFFYVAGVNRYPRYYFIGGMVGLLGWVLFAVEYGLRYIKSRTAALVVFATVLAIAIFYALPLYREKALERFHAETREVADTINQDDAIEDILWSGIGTQPFPVAAYYLNAHKRWLNLYGFVETQFEFEGKELEKLKPGTDFYWKGGHPRYVLVEQWDGTSFPVDFCAKVRFRNATYLVLECSTSEFETFFIASSDAQVRFPKIPQE